MISREDRIIGYRESIVRQDSGEHTQGTGSRVKMVLGRQAVPVGFQSQAGELTRDRDRSSPAFKVE